MIGVAVYQVDEVRVHSVDKVGVYLIGGIYSVGQVYSVSGVYSVSEIHSVEYTQ